VTEDKSRSEKKLKTTQKSKQHKIQQNRISLV